METYHIRKHKPTALVVREEHYYTVCSVLHVLLFINSTKFMLHVLSNTFSKFVGITYMYNV